jgi:hypothetical protein
MTDNSINKRDVVTYQPPRLDRRRVGYVKCQTDREAVDVEGFENYSESVNYDDPVYEVTPFKILSGGELVPIDQISHIPEGALTVNDRLTQQAAEIYEQING